MSKTKLELCKHILTDFHGELVSKVGYQLLMKGLTSLKQLAADTSLDIAKVQRALCILIQHGLVEFKKCPRGFIEYSINSDQVMWRQRFSRYVHCAKILYGDAAALLVEELLHEGQAKMTSILDKAQQRLNVTLEAAGLAPNLLQDKFTQLVQAHFVQRCLTSTLDDKKRVVGLCPPDNPAMMFVLPAMEVDGSSQGQKRKLPPENDIPNKKMKMDKSPDEDSSDSCVYWRVNFARFHRHFRDQALIAGVVNRLDKKAGEIMRAILRISEIKTDTSDHQTQPVSFTDIMGALPKDFGLFRSTVEQYLRIMTDDMPEFLSKCGESSGGMYSVNVFQALQALCTAHIESIVLERFGSKSLRIFRVILLKKQVEQRQIESNAMIPAKEAKELLYKMFEENFITQTELAKTPDHAPSRTFYLFTIDLKQVARMLLERCYKATSNVMQRRNLVIAENKRLLDKQERVDAIIASLEQQSELDIAQRAEIEETITPPERQQLNRVKVICNTLELSELQVDETSFILESYLALVLHPPTQKKRNSM